MMISLNKQGYEPFLDYIKAFAIICVLIGHTFPWTDSIGYGLWAGMQVPLFILVQSFHSLKKPVVKLNWLKLIWRIFVPYFIVQFVIILLLGIKNDYGISLITNAISGGGVWTRFIFSMDLLADCRYPEICPSYV